VPVASLEPTLEQDAHYLLERYRGGARWSPALAAFYAIKPAIPRRAQLAARRRMARRAATRSSFPAWPIDDVLERRRAATLRDALRASDAERLPFVNYWPAGNRFAVVLTHDVEGPLGLRKIPELLEIERRHGLVSSWNFVAEWYGDTAEARAMVVEAGCEVGLHGLTHDGGLFRSRAAFERQLPVLRRYLDEWEAVGFRSPSTLRNADWMPELPCEYDSSFSHSDPFQPQPGGCLSIFPFAFGDVVELPITLDQDFTLFELLGETSIDIWERKSRWVIENHGLINVIVHPDYMTPERLACYEQLLALLRGQAGGWHALPRDVARWWRRRAGLRCVRSADGATIVGRHGHGATVAWARLEGDRVVYDTARVDSSPGGHGTPGTNEPAGVRQPR